jgi:flagellar P-ring protein precursor FlgI
MNGPIVRLKDIARFRGIRSNTLTGVGLVLGLEGTGDSRKISATTQALANYLRAQGAEVDPRTLDTKNVALVMVTAELPPFAVNGQRLDVTVTSMGDAKSLRNGTLLFTELKAGRDTESVFATASGAVSIGGFGFGASGSSQQRGFLTVGRIPGGGVVEQGATTKLVFDGQMYLELNDPDITTAKRVQEAINQRFPEYAAFAMNGGTVAMSLPQGLSAVAALARLEELTVQTDNEATVVINERTGTIVIGGNVRIAPVAIASGAISVRIETEPFVSQPAPLSGGQTVQGTVSAVAAEEETAQIALLKPNTTVAELASIFQELRLKPGDIIAILQAMRQQGALKAKVVVQ